MEDTAPLAEDILIEILIYLPAKELIRFRSVSEYWLSLIKSPTFVTRHLQSDCNKTLLVKSYYPPETMRVSFLPRGDDILSLHDPNCPELLVSPSITVPYLDDVYAQCFVDLMGPCFGLICISFQEVIILCNPALREFKLLEPTPFACPEDYRNINYGSGFVYDANSNSCKIIQIWQIEENPHFVIHDLYTRIDLYNSSTNSWKVIDKEVPSVRYDDGEFNILFNGACHWQAYEIIKGPPTMGVILAFHLDNEVFYQFEFPKWFDDDKEVGLKALNQCLALIRYSEEVEEPDLIDIWVMKEYGVKESWTKELVIGPYRLKRPLLCWKDEWLIVEDMENQLTSHALNGNNQMKTCPFQAYDGPLRALIFKESIISLNGSKFSIM